MKFYIPASTRYVKIKKRNGVTGITVHEDDGTQIHIMAQDGSSPLAVHELISYGQILEAYKRINGKKKKYDAYIIFPSSLKPVIIKKPVTAKETAKLFKISKKRQKKIKKMAKEALKESN